MLENGRFRGKKRNKEKVVGHCLKMGKLCEFGLGFLERV